jgi:hypothetical protein
MEELWKRRRQGGPELNNRDRNCSSSGDPPQKLGTCFLNRVFRLYLPMLSFFSFFFSGPPCLAFCQRLKWSGGGMISHGLNEWLDVIHAWVWLAVMS